MNFSKKAMLTLIQTVWVLKKPHIVQYANLKKYISNVICPSWSPNSCKIIPCLRSNPISKVSIRSSIALSWTYPASVTVNGPWTMRSGRPRASSAFSAVGELAKTSCSMIIGARTSAASDSAVCRSSSRGLTSLMVMTAPTSTLTLSPSKPRSMGDSLPSLSLCWLRSFICLWPWAVLVACLALSTLRFC